MSSAALIFVETHILQQLKRMPDCDVWNPEDNISRYFFCQKIPRAYIYYCQQTCMNNSYYQSHFIRMIPACSSAVIIQIIILVQRQRIDFYTTACILTVVLIRWLAWEWLVSFCICWGWSWHEDKPWLLVKCWKTSEQDTLTTCPTSALSQHPISSHSVLHPTHTDNRMWGGVVTFLISLSSLFQ